MKARVAFLFALLVVAWSSALAQQGDAYQGEIIVHPDIKFVLKSPDGWELDTKAGRVDGVEAVLYPKGSSWKSAVVVMYARVVHKDETQATVEKAVANDIADFMKQNKESTVADSPSLPTRDKQQALVRIFYDAENKNYESVAYIDNDRVVVIVALSSHTKAEYEAALPAFRQLVASYFPFTLFG